MGLTNLTGRTALVTGAALRLGRAIALSLATEGANVVVHYHTSREPAEALAAEVAARGVQAWTISADLADPEQAATLLARAGELAGPLDILVNSASDFPPSTMDGVQWEDLQRQFALTAWAPFTLCRQFVAQTPTAPGGTGVSPVRGSIVNLLDSRMISWDWGHVAYLWAKQLLAHMTSHLALTYAPSFTVNGVAPGLILPPPGVDHSYLDSLMDTVPLRRHGDPEDIAAAVAFLLKSPFITGEVIFVDGGRHLAESVSGQSSVSGAATPGGSKLTLSPDD